MTMSIKKVTYKAMIIISLVIWSTQADSQSQERKIISWLTDNAHELSTTQLDAPQADLLFLKPMLKDKNIVSMGEATHGTKEFTAIKARFFKFLVQHLDFSVIAVEVDFSKALPVNDYVLGRRNDAENVVKNLGYFHCANGETLALIKWMREYNDQVKEQEKISFYGFDSYSPKDALHGVLEYFLKVDTLVASKVKEIKVLVAEGRYQFDVPYVRINDIEFLDEQIEADSLNYIRNSSYREWWLVKHLVTTLKYDLIKHLDNNASGSRDSLMKRNIDWIMDFEGAGTKIMLWAHNNHAMYGKVTAASGKEVKWMGLWLKEEYNDELYTIGFDFNKGQFYSNAFYRDFDNGKTIMKFKLTLFELGDTPKDRLTWWLSQTGKELLFINFSDAKGNELMEPWFQQKHRIRNIDALFLEEWKSYPEDCCYYPINPSASFDAIIFVKNTHAITRLD